MKRACLALFVFVCGCYESHGRREDAAVARADAGAACAFSVSSFDGVDVLCTIAASSLEGCTEAAVCLCDARGLTGVDAVQCAGWELTPRGALTFTDFCTYELPARMNMDEALDGYFGAGELRVSDACGATPALLGPRPFDGCGFLAEQLCPCGLAPCELDALLDRPCLTLTRTQVDCVRERVAENGACSVDVPAAVRACGG